VKVVGVFGMKGGVGKTSMTVNLAALAALDGRRTLVWDLDPQGAAAFLLQVKPKVKGGSVALLTGERGLAEAVRATSVPGLDLLPADVTIRTADLVLEEDKAPEKRLNRLLKTVRDDYDLVLLDCPPGLSLLSESVFRASDLLLMPLIPTPLSIRTYDQVLAFLEEIEDHRPRVHPVLSMVDGRKRVHSEVRAELMRQTTALLTAWVPASSAVERMAVHRTPLVVSEPRHPAARAYADIWAELRGLLA
jgi:cellulose biosynthesis protein BcsQ